MVSLNETRNSGNGASLGFKLLGLISYGSATFEMPQTPERNIQSSGAATEQKECIWEHQC